MLIDTLKVKRKAMTFEEKVYSLSEADVIRLMVDSLRNPACKINMDTFGLVENGICFGCAATNTIARLCEIKSIEPKHIEGYRPESMARYLTKNPLDVRLIIDFETMINELRSGSEEYQYVEGDVIPYELGNKEFKFPKSPKHLPILHTDFTEFQLEKYEEYADWIESMGVK